MATYLDRKAFEGPPTNDAPCSRLHARPPPMSLSVSKPVRGAGKGFESTAARLQPATFRRLQPQADFQSQINLPDFQLVVV